MKRGTGEKIGLAKVESFIPITGSLNISGTSAD
jgi:hypothetical protein